MPNARAFARAGTLGFDPNIRFPIFPQLSETLFAAALVVSDDLTAQLIELLCAALCAALLLRWSGESPGPAGRRIAAAVFFGSPLAVYLSSAAYIEAGVALFVTATLWAVERWRRERANDWLLLAGVFAGLAAATKYTGGVFAALALGSALLPRRSRPSDRGLALAAGGAIAVALPWYLRIFTITGNPVFPFLPRVFGSSPWQHDLDPVFSPQALASAGDLADHVLRVLDRPLVVLVDAALARHGFAALPPLSYAVALLSPALLFGAVVDRTARRFLVVFVFCCWTTGAFGIEDSSHYLLPLLPLLGLLAAIGVERIVARLALASAAAARLLAATAIAALLPGWLYAGRLLLRNGALPTDDAAREHYLARRMPGASALGYLNAERPAGHVVYGLFAENLRYCASGEFLGDFPVPDGYASIAPLLDRPDLLAARLRGIGVEFLLVPTRVGELLRRDRAFERRFRLVFADPDVKLYELSRE